MASKPADATEAKPKKEDEARAEEPAATGENGGAQLPESGPAPANPTGREQRLGSIDTLLLETGLGSVLPGAVDGGAATAATASASS
jgi:hypothetical protein